MQQAQPAVELPEVEDVEDPPDDDVAAPDVELDVFEATVPDDEPLPCCWVWPVFESSSPQPAAVRPTPRTTIV